MGIRMLLPLVASGIDTRTLTETQYYALWLLPLIVLQTVTAAVSAVFNSTGAFWQPAAATVLRYVSTLALVVLLRPLMGPESLPAAFVIGAFLQLAATALGWRIAGVRYSIRFAFEPELRRVARLAWPLLVGAIILQLAAVVMRILAAHLSAGSVSVFDYASRIAIAIVELLSGGFLLVTLADWSATAAHSGSRERTLQQKLQAAIKVVLFVILPATALGIGLAKPLIAFALQRGKFDAGLADWAASVLILFLIGAPFDVLGRLYVRVLLAWQDTLGIALLAGLRLVVTTFLAIWLIRLIDVRGLALADTIALSAVFVGLVLRVRPSLGDTLSGLGVPLLKLLVCAAAALAMATVTNAFAFALPPAVTISLGVLATVGIYLASAWVLNVREFRLLLDWLRLERLSPGV